MTFHVGDAERLGDLPAWDCKPPLRHSGLAPESPCAGRAFQKGHDGLKEVPRQARYDIPFSEGREALSGRDVYIRKAEEVDSSR